MPCSQTGDWILARRPPVESISLSDGDGGCGVNVLKRCLDRLIGVYSVWTR